MQINSINSYQQNFKGQLIFRNVKPVKSEFNGNVVRLMAVTSEDIALIMEKYRFPVNKSQNILYEANKANKTIIKMITGDVFEVDAEAKEVIEAKKNADGTNKVIEPGIYEL